MSLEAAMKEALLPSVVRFAVRCAREAAAWRL
jgi:hypothetical protein